MDERALPARDELEQMIQKRPLEHTAVQLLRSTPEHRVFEGSGFGGTGRDPGGGSRVQEFGSLGNEVVSVGTVGMRHETC